MENDTYDIFYNKLSLAGSSFISDCKSLCIDNHHNYPYFDIWLSVDAGREIWNMYVENFNNHFHEYITDKIKEQMYISSKNIIYAVRTYITMNTNTIDTDKLIDCIDTFLNEQIHNFEDDYELNFPSDNTNIEEEDTPGSCI